MKKAESPKKSSVTKAKPASKKPEAKPVAKKKTAVKAADKPVAKPVAKKSAVKAVAAKTVAKKTAVKAVAAKPAAKKTAVKAVAAKPVAKKTAVKAVAAKPVAKTVAKKTAVKAVAAKPAAKKTAVKAVAAKTVAKKSAVRKSNIDENGEIIHHHKKLKLTKAKQKFYTELLMHERQKFLGQLEFHQNDALSSKKDSASERAGMATHMADLGTDNFRHEMELGLLSDEGDVLSMIDEALQRIKDSEYGICVECGCEISPARLASKPYARFCVRCKSAHEKMEDPIRRHR